MGFGDNYSLDVIKSFILYLFHHLIIIYFRVQRIRIYNGPESTKELNLQWSQIYDGLESTAGCALGHWQGGRLTKVRDNVGN